MIVMSKPQLRAAIRAHQGGRAAREEQSAAIARHILDSEVYRNAHVIAGYIPMQHEADITPVLQDALLTGKVLVLPLCGKAPEMTLHRVNSLEELVPGAYGIPEPSAQAPAIDATRADLILVPLEGIDPEGYRLGKGGGYYDHLLAGRNRTSMGCALAWQLVEFIPREPWDVPLHMCATPEGLLQY